MGEHGFQPGFAGVLAQDTETGFAVALIEGAGLLATVAGLLIVLIRGTGLPREARMVLAGVLLLAFATHFWALIEWTTNLRMDQYVDLGRVVTPILWMFFVYALSGELLRESLRREEGRRTVMMRELDHRVKNNLTAVIAMAEQTSAWSKDLKSFMGAFLGRVRALGRAHEALAAARWEGVDLERIVRITLEPFDGPEVSASGNGQAAPSLGELDGTVGAEAQGVQQAGSRIRISGERVTLPPRTSSAVCMTLHELATNAAKYGALSIPQGRVSVRWEVVGGEKEPGSVRLRWAEQGGPPVRCGPEGLGTGLIKGIVEYELGGRVDLEMAPGGVQCLLEVPLGGTAVEFGRLTGSRA